MMAELLWKLRCFYTQSRKDVHKSDVKGDTVYTWEGNSGGKVAAHTYDLSDTRIVGYGLF